MRRRLGEIGQTLDIEPTDYQGTTPGGRSACADAWNARRVQAVEAVKNAFEAAYVSPDHQNLPVLRAALEAVPLYRGRPTWADEAIRDALAAVKTLCWLAKEQELRRLAEEIPWMRR